MPGTRTVALATCAELPRGDEDSPALVAALRERGIPAWPAVWDDTAVAWHWFDLVVLRSTWDYAERRDQFLAWAGGLPQVANPLPVLAWSSDKRYLLELAAVGVPVVPTELLEPGDAFRAPALTYVVKPAVSAGARNAAAYEGGDERGRDHVAALHADGRAVLLQPYAEGLEERGETGLVYLGGAFSHAFSKRPILRPGDRPTARLFAEEAIAERRPSDAERAVGDAVLSALPFAPGDLLYARVDLVPGAHNEPLVLEVELVEPSLYLAYDEGAVSRCADAIAARVTAR